MTYEFSGHWLCTIQALFQSNVNIVLSIFDTCNLGAQIKDLYTCVKEKLKFFINYDKWLQQFKNFYYEAYT